MTLTLTTDELADFQSKLREWYHACMIWVLEKASNDWHHRLDGRADNFIHELLERYAKEHPKPDWRTLL